MKKKTISLIAAFMMIMTVFAIPVFAEENAGATTDQETQLEDFRWSEWTDKEPEDGKVFEEGCFYRYRIATKVDESTTYTSWSDWMKESVWTEKEAEVQDSLEENQELKLNIITVYREKLPLLEQTITSEESYTKTYGATAFNLNAKAETQLSYASDNKAVASVANDGTVNINGTGTAVITITAAREGDYAAAEKKVTVTVNKASQVITGSGTVTKTFAVESFKLNVAAKTAMSYSSSNAKILTVAKDGTVTMKNPGTATITVKAAETNQYKPATKQVKVTVKLVKPDLEATAIGNKKVKLRWTQVYGATNYQVYMYNSVKKKYVLKATGSSTSGSFIYKGVKGKTYKFKVRAYRTVDGKKIYSPYSPIRSVKAK